MAITYTGKQRFIDLLYTFQCCLPSQLSDIIGKEQIGKACHEDKLNLMKAFVYMDVLKDQIQYFKFGREGLGVGESEDDGYYIINGCLTKAQMEKLLRQLKLYCNECCADIQLD